MYQSLYKALKTIKKHIIQYYAVLYLLNGQMSQIWGFTATSYLISTFYITPVISYITRILFTVISVVYRPRLLHHQ